MSSLRLVAHYEAVRRQPLGQLLAAANGPVVMALLETLWQGQPRSLPASLVEERLTRELTLLKNDGYDLPQSAANYLYDWLKHGWLERHLRHGATEEEYQLSSHTAQALRFMQTQLKHRSVATESRLANVITQLRQLADETNDDQAARLAHLEAERDRVLAEIEQVQRGHVKTLSEGQALERLREVLALSEELTHDFHRVRDAFAQLNRKLRADILENEGSRGEVLESLFAGVDLIGNSEEGRTFKAFWRLLTSPDQSASLLEALDSVTSRPFARRLDPAERRFLYHFTDHLMTEGSQIHEVQLQFASSLKTFVQSRAFLEHRRIQDLLRQAQKAALELKETLSPTKTLPFALPSSLGEFRSPSQWRLHDPALHTLAAPLDTPTFDPLDLSQVGELVRQSDIDFPALKQQIRTLLTQRDQVTIHDVLQAYPASQGLGSVIGLVSLATRHAVPVPNATELIHWQDKAGTPRHATLPVFYFIQERAHDLR